MTSDQPNDNLTVATCPVCNRRVRIVNPPGGDGTARLFTRHRSLLYGAAAPCPGSRREVALDED